MKYKKYNYSSLNLINISFNLYGLEFIRFEASKKEILKGFKKEYLTDIKTKLKEIGLKLHNIKYYSPKYYNYEGDDLDFIISISNLNLIKNICVKLNILSIEEILKGDFKDINFIIDDMIKIFSYLKLDEIEFNINEYIVLDRRLKENKED